MAAAEVALGCAQPEGGCTLTEEGHTLMRAALTEEEGRAALEEGRAAFMAAERELVPLILLLQERIKPHNIPCTRNDEHEAAQVELKRIKADLCLAKMLLSDLEMSTRSMVELPTRRELGARVKGHRETLALLESHLACNVVELEMNRCLEEATSVTMIHTTSGFQSRARRLLAAIIPATSSGQAREKKAGAAAPAFPLTCALV